MTVAQFDLGTSGVIINVGGSDAVAQRLMAMGFLPGTPIRVVNVAPFGDPITVELNGWRCSLRRAEAAALHVEHP